MTNHLPAARRRAGFTLMELLLAVTVLTFVTGATYALFRSQSQNFKSNTARYDLIESARGAIEASERIIRTMGARADQQRPDESHFGCLDGAAQRAFVTGMGDGGRRRGEFAAAGEQAFVFGVLLFHGESPDALLWANHRHLRRGAQCRLLGHDAMPAGASDLT